jgi:hypothetical protein
MSMHVRARQMVVRSGTAVVRILADGRMLFVAMVMPTVIVRWVRVHAVSAMRVGVEGCQHACISVRAADADCGSNDEKMQKLASQVAHSSKKTEDSRRVKPSE